MLGTCPDDEHSQYQVSKRMIDMYTRTREGGMRRVRRVKAMGGEGIKEGAGKEECRGDSSSRSSSSSSSSSN